MTTRRISALLLALVLAFALCACGAKEPAGGNDASANLEGVPAIPDFTNGRWCLPRNNPARVEFDL